jgi:hypothetical protein
LWPLGEKGRDLNQIEVIIKLLIIDHRRKSGGLGEHDTTMKGCLTSP